MKLRYPIDLHKGSTVWVVLGLMAYYRNWSVGPWVYLALHGTYGLLWVFKSYTYPDPAWERRVPIWKGCGAFVTLLSYWAAPLLLVRSGAIPPAPLISLSVALVVFGTCLHFGSDAQKYFALKAKRGLITDGFFARTRNPNYLGEGLIYSGFATLSMHWVPWVVLAVFFGAIWVPNMLRKDRSLARYPEFASYRARTGFLFPRLLQPRE